MLMAKWESVPFPQAYDYAVTGLANVTLSLTVNNPRLGYWYLLVMSTVATTIRVSPTYQSPPTLLIPFGPNLTNLSSFMCQ